MKNRLFIYFSILLFLLISCTTSHNQQKIMTVNGSIDTKEHGMVLEHEHILVDFIGADSTGYFRWNRDSVIARVMPYLEKAKDDGVNLFFDPTPAYLGRDPRLLKQLADKSGLQIVTNTGYYGAVDNKFLPEHAFRESADQLAQRWIGEWEDGIEDTGIRPGFIKISVNPVDTLSAIHEKLVRAAARTHLQTGLTIASHTGPDGPAMAQLKILKDEGVSPKAFVWVHAQNGTPEGWMKAAGQGAWISLDNVKRDSTTIDKYVRALAKLKEAGYLQNVLLSHDAGWYEPGKPNGGSFRGYTAIFDALLPRLKEEGFSQDEIDQLMVRNPRQAFGIRVRAL